MLALASKSISSANASDEKGARWPAYLQLDFCGDEGVTKLSSSSHKGPLYVQKPFYPEGRECAHIYLLHPPGGVVSGDSLNITLNIKAGAKVLVTAPGATRLYRARSDIPGVTPLEQRIDNILAAKGHSLIEWLPHETIVFDGAHISLNTQVRLDSSSLFLGWEILCLGLPASDKPFISGSFYQSFTITVDDVPVIIDRLNYCAESNSLNSQAGFNGRSVYGTFMLGPVVENCESIQEKILSLLSQEESRYLFSVTQVNQFFVLRYLGNCSDQAKQMFIKVWGLMRPVLSQRDALKPRIWAT